MKYRLKNKELQAKLDELCDGKDGFSAALQAECEKKLNDWNMYVLVHFGKVFPFKSIVFHRYEIWFKKDEIETVSEYTPNRWNAYPEVVPPKGVLMRLEFKHTTSDDKENYQKVGVCAEFDGEYWRYPWGMICDLSGLSKDFRFRPWDEEDEE